MVEDLDHRGGDSSAGRRREANVTRVPNCGLAPSDVVLSQPIKPDDRTLDIRIDTELLGVQILQI